jgi:hypothetical protein
VFAIKILNRRKYKGSGMEELLAERKRQRQLEEKQREEENAKVN